MKRLEIMPPDYNDSFSKVVFGGREFLLRFTWLDTQKRWTYGIYDVFRNPIVQGVKLVPNFPLDLQYVDKRLPGGVIGVYSKLAAVGREDFKNGKAIFAYIPQDGGVGL
jgi:hypothetical protein